MELIYIGDRFYHASGTIMSSIYTVDGQRSDWGFVQIALSRGDYVHIRQATEKEREFYDKKLENLKKEENK